MTIYIEKATRKATGEESFYIVELDDYNSYMYAPWNDLKNAFSEYIETFKKDYTFSYIGSHKIEYANEYNYRWHIADKLKEYINCNETYKVIRLHAIQYVSESTLTSKIKISESSFDIVNGHILYDQLYGNSFMEPGKKSKFQKFDI